MATVTLIYGDGARRTVETHWMEGYDPDRPDQRHFTTMELPVDELRLADVVTLICDGKAHRPVGMHPIWGTSIWQPCTLLTPCDPLAADRRQIDMFPPDPA